MPSSLLYRIQGFRFGSAGPNGVQTSSVWLQECCPRWPSWITGYHHDWIVNAESNESNVSLFTFLFQTTLSKKPSSRCLEFDQRTKQIYYECWCFFQAGTRTRQNLSNETACTVMIALYLGKNCTEPSKKVGHI